MSEDKSPTTTDQIRTLQIDLQDRDGILASQLCTALCARPDLLASLYMEIKGILEACHKDLDTFEVWRESTPFFMALLVGISLQLSESLSGTEFYQEEYEKMSKYARKLALKRELSV